MRKRATKPTKHVGRDNACGGCGACLRRKEKIMTGIKAIPSDAPAMFIALALITPELDTERMVGLACDLKLAQDRYNSGENLDSAERFVIDLQSEAAEEVYQMAVTAFDLASDRCGAAANDTDVEEGVENGWKSCLQFVESALKVRLS
jgi:hypothetical protein